MKKSYEQLTIRDPFMFGKVVQDHKNAQTLINALLGQDIEINRGIAEKYSQQIKAGKYVRFDLYAQSNEGTVYDAEMQNYSQDAERQIELPWRSRYYQCMIDGELLKSGMHYRNLNDTYIIFICDFDPFGRNKYRYTILPACREDSSIEFDDGTVRIFFNINGDMTDAPITVKNMLEYIRNGITSDKETRQLDAAVQAGRENEEWRAEFMLTFVHDRDVYADGYTEGKAEGKAEGRLIEIYQSVQDGDYSLERGAGKLGIPSEILIKQMEDAGFRVPIVG